MCSYLFVLAMVGLKGIFREADQDLRYHNHWRCQQESITHLCFVDDLMIYYQADKDSVRVLKRALDDFAVLLGLVINPNKSHVFLLGVDDDLKASLLDLLGFRLGSLPIRYLGVPLITTRLKHSDCMALVERILSKIRFWTSAFLIYASHLQLIKFVLFSIQVYCSTMFILPCSIIRKIEGLLVVFL
jgi:hypothetical protein